MKLFVHCRHQVVNQFPYEGCIVRKDLLPQTARRRLRSYLDASQAPPTLSASWHPAWLPATYDLSTEIQFFLEDYARVRRGMKAVLPGFMAAPL